MVRTRSGSGIDADVSKSETTADKENVKPGSAKKSQDLESSKKGGKRKSGEQQVPAETKKQKQDTRPKADTKSEKSEIQANDKPAQKASKTSASAKESNKKDKKKEQPAAEKPRLTTPDIEFEYDRSQLRDPRPTPGRVRKPRYSEFDIPPDMKAEISSKFHIPKPEKPKGRLNWMQKDELFRQEGLMNPLHCFHDDYKCRKKGRSGSPTYDSAGFQLDWKKLDGTHKQNERATKSSVVDGMERHLNRVDRERKEIFQIFFKGDMNPGETAMAIEDYVKDHVSKDLNIPWHQIGPKELKQWETKGFEKQDMATWWREPNEEERKRMDKMHVGCIYRKDF